MHGNCLRKLSSLTAVIEFMDIFYFFLTLIWSVFGSGFDGKVFVYKSNLHVILT